MSEEERDPKQCPCGHRGVVSSEAPPFWEVNGQMWHSDCFERAHPELREQFQAAKDRYLLTAKPWIARVVLP